MSKQLQSKCCNPPCDIVLLHVRCQPIVDHAVKAPASANTIQLLDDISDHVRRNIYIATFASFCAQLMSSLSVLCSCAKYMIAQSSVETCIVLQNGDNKPCRLSWLLQVSGVSSLCSQCQRYPVLQTLIFSTLYLLPQILYPSTQYLVSCIPDPLICTLLHSGPLLMLDVLQSTSKS